MKRNYKARIHQRQVRSMRRRRLRAAFSVVPFAAAIVAVIVMGRPLGYAVALPLLLLGLGTLLWRG